MLVRELRASLAFVERNLYCVKRYMAWEIVFLTYSVVNVLTIALIGVASGDPDRVLFLTIGGVLWGFLGVIFHEVAENLAWERWEGTIEYTLMAPIRRMTHLTGICFAGIIYGVARTIVILLVTALFLHISLHKANVVSALVILGLSSLSFIGMGLMGAVLPLLSPEKGAQAVNIFQSLILLVSGVYYDVSVLPAWLQPFSRLSPATYTLSAMRKALLNGSGITDLWREALFLIAFGALFIPLGFAAFRWAEKRAKRTGGLSRNG